MKTQASHRELVPHLFRQEYAKMTAVLCRHFGLKYIEIAEDITSDTFLKASEHWAINGVPENPTAWLYTVAKNKARDYFKRTDIFEKQIKHHLKPGDTEPGEMVSFSDQLISGSQLAMIFAVCHPANSGESQIALALQILCGFSVEEIANAFLSKRETIKKRLQRARNNLRNTDFQIKSLSKAEIQSRQGTVLKTLYLLFNEGYYSTSGNNFIRKELCSEAMRLILVLIENPLTNSAQTNALLALMCFQSSRIEARTNEKGEVILFDEQDKNLWDTTLIERGNYYLVNATNKKETSKYHLEAAIAYWHTTTRNGKWVNILKLYNQLVLIEFSPVMSLNRVFAMAKVYGNAKALSEVKNLKPMNTSYYHSLLGYLYEKTEVKKSISHYNLAISLSNSEPEKLSLKKKIGQLNRI